MDMLEARLTVFQQAQSDLEGIANVFWGVPIGYGKYQKQARFYFEGRKSGQSIIVKVMRNKGEYSYEYLRCR